MHQPTSCTCHPALATAKILELVQVHGGVPVLVLVLVLQEASRRAKRTLLSSSLVRGHLGY